MEERNKYLCPDCGEKMNVSYDKPALNLWCPKCGCRVATTKWDEIDLDTKEYEIVVKAILSPSLEQLKLVSKLLDLNFTASKKKLQEDVVIFNGKAVEVKKMVGLLKQNGFEFLITPEYKYEL